MKAMLLLVLLPACAMFDTPVITAPARVCLIGNCADLVPIERDLRDPEFLKRVDEAKPGVPR